MGSYQIVSLALGAGIASPRGARVPDNFNLRSDWHHHGERIENSEHPSVR